MFSVVSVSVQVSLLADSVSLIFSCWHFHAFVSLSFVCLFKGDCRQARQKKEKKKKRMSSLELRTSQSQDAKRSSKSCFMTLITSSFPPICVSVYMCVCVWVYRVFPHLESELCFPLGPFPCSEKSFLLPASPGSPPPSSFKPLFPVRARQKVGLLQTSACELAPKPPARVFVSTGSGM